MTEFISPRLRLWCALSATDVQRGSHHVSRGSVASLIVPMQIGHSDYVVALAAIPAGKCSTVPGLGLVSGGRDKTVNIWDVEECAAVQQLQGHKYQVNAVGVLSSGDVVSGGLDGVLNMWKGGKAVYSMSEHKTAILCLCVLSSGQILTGMRQQISEGCALRRISGV
jgi:WD40 repeat protein